MLPPVENGWDNRSYAFFGAEPPEGALVFEPEPPEGALVFDPEPFGGSLGENDQEDVVFPENRPSALTRRNIESRSSVSSESDHYDKRFE